ncbi:MAG: recombination protein RecR [Clostridia bacterium]|nr:recombination protein RecR [Clostridia bacterium]
MADYIYPVARLIECFRRLPGVGSKSAARMAFGVLEMSPEDAEEFRAAIKGVKEDVRRCSVCCDLCDSDKCAVCSDPGRDQSVICVVEDSRTVSALERSHEFHGTYHVLGGVISPMNGITPDRLNVKELITRLNGTVNEVIIATNPNIEGETTAVYLSKLIRPLGVKVTRLAYGVPVGADLEFADSETLARALEGRREF